jgi:uncharacterized protein YodC (DUF2158 family)
MQSVWKSGSVVSIGSDGTRLCVIGYDSVGSVICTPFESADGRERLYVTPTLLRRIVPEGGPATCEDVTG